VSFIDARVCHTQIGPSSLGPFTGQNTPVNLRWHPREGLLIVPVLGEKKGRAVHHLATVPCIGARPSLKKENEGGFLSVNKGEGGLLSGLF